MGQEVNKSLGGRERIELVQCDEAQVESQRDHTPQQVISKTPEDEERNIEDQDINSSDRSSWSNGKRESDDSEGQRQKCR